MTNVTTRWQAAGVMPGKLRHEHTATTLQFQAKALTGGIKAADVIGKRVGVAEATARKCRPRCDAGLS